MPISNPTDIADLTQWYDSSHTASFTFSSGNIVQQWNDRSSHARNISQATAGSRPTRSGSQNGLSTVVFDGVDDYLIGTAWTWPPDNPFTLFVMFKATTSQSGDRAIYTNDSGEPLIEQLDNDNIAFSLNNAAPEQAGQAPLSLSEWHWATHKANGASSEQRLDGVQTGTGSMTTDSNIGILRTVLGAVNWGGFNWAGEIAEVISYDRALTSGEITDVEDYLTNKWFAPPPVGWLLRANDADRLLRANDTDILHRAAGPGVDDGQELVLPALSIAVTLHAPGVTTGPVNVSPPAIDRTAALVAPTVQGPAQSLTAPAINSAAVVTPPSLTPGPVALSPPAQALTVTQSNPTLTRGPVSVSPPVISLPAALSAPTLTPGPVGLNPPVIDLTAVLSPPTVANTPAGFPIFETWTGTNGDPWDPARWTDTGSAIGSHTAQIQGNRGRITVSGGTFAFGAMKAGVNEADIDLLVSWATLDSAEQYPEVYFRIGGYTGGLPSSGYAVEMWSSTDQVYLAELDGSGGITYPITVNAAGIQDTDRHWLRIVAVGTSIRVRWWDDGSAEPGTWQINTTRTHASTGDVALGHYSGSSATARSIDFDDLSVVTPAGAPSLLLPVLSLAVQLHAPSLAPGAVNVEPPAIAIVAALHAPSLVPGAVAVSPPPIASTVALHSPTVTRGAVSVAPPAINAAAVLSAPALTPGPVSVSPPVISSPAALSPPVITTGGSNVILPVISVAAALHAMSLAPGPVSVSPPVISILAALSAPSIANAVNLMPPGIDLTALLRNPSLTVGAVSVSPPVINSAAALHMPTVRPPTQTLQAPSIASTVVLRLPTLTRGPVSLAPPAQSIPATPNPPIITQGGVFVVLPTQSLPAQLHTPTLTRGPVTISPPNLELLAALNAPSLAPGPVTLLLPGLPIPVVLHPPRFSEIPEGITVINFANAVFLGDVPVERVYAGDIQVWP